MLDGASLNKKERKKKRSDERDYVSMRLYLQGEMLPSFILKMTYNANFSSGTSSAVAGDVQSRDQRLVRFLRRIRLLAGAGRRSRHACDWGCEGGQMMASWVLLLS